MKLEIEVVGKGKAVAVLDDRNPETAEGIYESLPLEADATKWLEEVYFGMELKMDYENPSPQTEAGDLSYWPPGPAFCVFFGESQPVSDVNNFGKVTENLELFRKVQDGDKLIIRKL